MKPSKQEFLLNDAVKADSLELKKLKWENRLLKGVVASFVITGVVVGVFSLGRQWQHEIGVGPATPLRSPVSLPSTPATTTLAPPMTTRSASLDEQGAASLVEIPEFFDAREQWLGCGTFVVDQGQCGGCWAASATNVLGDRACIHLMHDGSPITLPHSGAHGIGSLERMFQQAGRCIGVGTMNMAHVHGCQRRAYFLSPQALLSCGNLNNTKAPRFNAYAPKSGYMPGHTLYPSSAGCNGGEAHDAWRYFYHEGLTVMDGTQEGGCTPYTSGLCFGSDPANNGCHVCNFDQCADTGLEPERITVQSFGWIMEEDLPERGHWMQDESFQKNGTDKPRPEWQQAAMDRQVRKMQLEIMTNGPIHTCIDVFTNFPTFWNDVPQGIYNSTQGTPMEGGHCIELMGWGTDSLTGMKYWTWKNSWGINFANGGFGRIIRGVDLLGIESDVWAACPSGSRCELTAGVVHNETWIPRHAWEPTSGARRKGGDATSAKAPSRSWPGGKEIEMKRRDFSHPTIAPVIVEAARRALDNPMLGQSEALAAVERVWTRSVRGTRVRVQVKGVSNHAVATRHMEGHTTVE